MPHPQAVILASGSPRRKELLNWANIPHLILVPDVDESPLRKESPQKMVERLARMKAETISKTLLEEGGPVQLHSGAFFIIAADTTVVSPSNKNLGKPGSAKEAVRMIQSLQGRRHFVFTAYSIIKIDKGSMKKTIVRSVRTDVHMKKLSNDEIASYIAKGESMDKAGAYAAQGYGMVLIDRIVGSYTNVVGLPIAQVVQDLKKLGYKKKHERSARRPKSNSPGLRKRRT